MKFTENAHEILKQRYLARNKEGTIVETPIEMFRRVAKNVAAIDFFYDEDVRQSEEKFFHLMSSLDFLPNSPTLMNAGLDLQQLSACFVVPVPDSIEGIFNAVKNAALIHKSGGGTGFSFSRLRSSGYSVRSTGGVASGPVSFMRVFDTATDVVKQGGKRRGANMGVLRVDHPDILQFITAKNSEGAFTNFNLSVAITDKFIDHLENTRPFSLIEPRTGDIIETVHPAEIWTAITQSAWRNGEPGLIFIDRINDTHPANHLGEIETTNPCGEQPLLPYESCNLGSINLANMVKGHPPTFDSDRFSRAIISAVHFLDNVIDANKYPLREIEETTKRTRKIGLGVMGYADLLIKLGYVYGSDRANSLTKRIMQYLYGTANEKSIRLAKTRGQYPGYRKDPDDKRIWRRNATLTTIAPTGTISMIADCSNGIEPLFAIVYNRLVMGNPVPMINSLFKQMMTPYGGVSEQLATAILQNKGRVQGLDEIPSELQYLFSTSFDIPVHLHITVQSIFQQFTDNGVSKTINLPNHATQVDVHSAFLTAYHMGCKGITVYRDGSRNEQVLST